MEKLLWKVENDFSSGNTNISNIEKTKEEKYAD
jgi:hypothetical protein